MSRAKEIYKKDVWGWGFSDYQPIVNYFGNVIAQVEEGDYQGSTYVAYEKDGKYGFLCFGWGSCSGCDALKGCGDFEELDELINDLENNIKWFNSVDELKSYITNDYDRAGSHYYHEEEWKEFRDKVEAL